MTKRNTAALFLAGVAALTLVAVPTVAQAGPRDKARVICQSGKKASNIKKCKEYGGRR